MGVECWATTEAEEEHGASPSTEEEPQSLSSAHLCTEQADTPQPREPAHPPGQSSLSPPLPLQVPQQQQQQPLWGWWYHVPSGRVWFSGCVSQKLELSIAIVTEGHAGR